MKYCFKRILRTFQKYLKTIYGPLHSLGGEKRVTYSEKFPIYGEIIYMNFYTFAYLPEANRISIYKQYRL